MLTNTLVFFFEGTNTLCGVFDYWLALFN